VSTGQIFFVVGIVGMIASAVAAAFSARILRRREEKLKKQIWNEYQ
jgi:type II secretory pathway pseudopilin PulG